MIFGSGIVITGGLTALAPVPPPEVEYLVVAGGYRVYTWTGSGSITF